MNNDTSDYEIDFFEFFEALWNAKIYIALALVGFATSIHSLVQVMSKHLNA